MNTALALVALMSTGGAEDLQALLDKMRVEQQVPGVSAVVTMRSEVIFASASGVADLETERAMTPDTIIYAGSLSKILTAVLTLQLAEKDALELDDVVTGIAVKPSGEGATARISQLLSHASGLDREGNFDYWFNADFPDKCALEDYLSGVELHTTPGSSFHYSNIGYAALGLVIERSSGQSYADALESRVLVPLGMAASGALKLVPAIAAGYSPVGSVLPNQQRPFAGLGHRVGERRIREYHNARSMTPAFGIHTNVRDLSLLARFLLGFAENAVLSDEVRLQMLTAQPSGWGLGIRIGQYKGRAVARHGGWFAAHQSHLLLDLQSGIAVVVQANSDSAAPGKIAEALLDSVLEHEQ